MKPWKRSTIVLDHREIEGMKNWEIVCTFNDQKIVEMSRKNPKKVISIIRKAFSRLSDDFDVMLRARSEKGDGQ